MGVRNTILCIGDSLTFGARDSHGSSYPFEMESYLEEGFGGDWLCIERGICGETSAQLRRRFYQEVKAVPEAYEICLLIGTNDTKDEVNTPPKFYRRYIAHMVKVATVYFQRKIFVGMLPGRADALAPVYSGHFSSRVYDYNKEIRRVVRESTAWAVDLGNLKTEDYEDGLHFSNKGNRKVASSFADAIMAVRAGTIPITMEETGVIVPANFRQDENLKSTTNKEEKEKIDEPQTKTFAV